MAVREYLPSVQFSLFVVSLAIAGGLIYSAKWYPQYKSGLTKLESVSDGTQNSRKQPNTTGWQTALAASTPQPDSPDASKTDDLVKGAQTSSLTDSIGRALLINTTAAAGEGLGGDQPTQERIVAATLSQVASAQPKPSLYKPAAITPVPDTSLSLYTYGNALALAIGSVPQSTYTETMLAVGFAVDSSDGTALTKLDNIAKGYRSLAKAIVALPTPVSLADAALQAANNYIQMAAACDDMTGVLSDPARGLTGIQTYNTLIIQNTQVFTQIAQTMQKNAILFSTSDAGQAWGFFLAAAQKAAAQAPTQPQRSSL